MHKLATGGKMHQCDTSSQSTSSTATHYQTKLPGAPYEGGPIASHDTRLNMAIADFIHAGGFPFSLVEDPHLKEIIKFARHASSNYSPPSRKAISTSLLDLNFETHQAKNRQLLLKEAKTFGLSFYCDGATVKKMPLMNIMSAGVHIPNNVLEIADCTDLLVKGDTKDASAIVRLFLPHMEKIDPNKELIDLVYFDGAGNVQKAGRVLRVHYPRITTLHGAEHVVSLFFKDVCSLPPIKHLIHQYKKIYSLFGSGSHHAPYAIFSKQAKDFNNGKAIGLTRAADTQMAGHFGCFLCLLCLTCPLLATMNSVQFQQIKLQPKDTKTADIIKDNSFLKKAILLC